MKKNLNLPLVLSSTRINFETSRTAPPHVKKNVSITYSETLSRAFQGKKFSKYTPAHRCTWRVHAHTENERTLVLDNDPAANVPASYIRRMKSDAAGAQRWKTRSGRTLNYLSRNYSFMLIRLDTPADLELLPA